MKEIEPAEIDETGHIGFRSPRIGIIRISSQGISDARAYWP